MQRQPQTFRGEDGPPANPGTYSELGTMLDGVSAQSSIQPIDVQKKTVEISVDEASVNTGGRAAIRLPEDSRDEFVPGRDRLDSLIFFPCGMLLGRGYAPYSLSFGFEKKSTRGSGDTFEGRRD